MDESNAVEFLNSLQRFGWRLGLETILRLLRAMGNPHAQFKSIHVAGTNGKGSTAAMLESIFRHAGYRTGLFTSPHLLSLTERIQVDAEPIALEKLTGYVQEYQRSIQSLGGTYFETLCAIAFRYFADSGIDVAIVEVGLGGRLDATNVILPELTIITEIDFDHTEHLGSTLSEIAIEKACIMKPGVPCLAQSQNTQIVAVLNAHALEARVPFFSLQDFCAVKQLKCTENSSVFDIDFSHETFSKFEIPLVGRFQINNAALAVAATQLLVDSFELERPEIYDGLRNVSWPGRLQKLQENPKIVVDVAHNLGAINHLFATLTSVYRYHRLIVVVGLLRDKKYREIAKIIASNADIIFAVTPNSERALDSHLLANELSKPSNQVVNCSTQQEGFQKAVSEAAESDLVCVTGSHYVAADFIKFFKKA